MLGTEATDDALADDALSGGKSRGKFISKKKKKRSPKTRGKNVSDFYQRRAAQP